VSPAQRKKGRSGEGVGGQGEDREKLTQESCTESRRLSKREDTREGPRKDRIQINGEVDVRGGLHEEGKHRGKRANFHNNEVLVE